MSGYYKYTVSFLAADAADAESKSLDILESLCDAHGEAGDCPILGGEGPVFVEVDS